MKLPKKFEEIATLKIEELVSVRNKLNFSMKYWYMEAKNVFWTHHGPKKGSKYHLLTVQTTFSENNKYYRTIFVKLNFFHA